MPCGLMARRLTLDQFIEVRILAGQPEIKQILTATCKIYVSGFFVCHICTVLLIYYSGTGVFVNSTACLLLVWENHSGVNR